MKFVSTSALLVVGVALSGCGGAGGGASDPMLRCTTCHAINAGDPKRSGPSLHGIIGKQAASEAGYAYSSALKQSGITWTPEKLDAFIANPNQVVPGNRMGFAGEPDAARRKVIVDTLVK